MQASEECRKIEERFKELCSRPKQRFPEPRQQLSAPSTHGVYIILKGEEVLHVGRTLRGENGLRQRLRKHLDNSFSSSSFTQKYLAGKGATLRNEEYTYQYLELADPRDRALLEAYAIGMLCPKHIGLGE